MVLEPGGGDPQGYLHGDCLLEGREGSGVVTCHRE